MRIFEGGELEEGAFCAWLDADAHECDGDGGGGEADKSKGAGRPGKTGGLLEFVEDNGVDDTADAGSRGGDAVCEGAFLAEILGEEGDGGDEEAAGADADAEALGEHDLVVFCGEGGHHVAEDDHEAAEGDEEWEVA